MVTECRQCKHVRLSGIEMTCHRYPPTVLIEEVTRRGGFDDYKIQVATSRFPEVNETDYCGEFTACST